MDSLVNALREDALRNENAWESGRVREFDVSDCNGLDMSKDFSPLEVVEDYMSDIDHEFCIEEYALYAP